MNRSVAELSLLSCTLIWASTFVVTQDAIQNFPAPWFVTLRFAIAVFAYAPFAVKALSQLSRSGWKDGLSLGALLVLGYGLGTYSLLHTTASRSAFFVGLQVIFAALFDRKPLSFDTLCGIALSLLGLYGLLAKDVQSLSVSRGDVAALLCAAVWGVYFVMVDRSVRQYDVKALCLIQFSTVALVGAVFSLTRSVPLVPLSSNVWLSLLYIAFIATLAALVLQNHAQRYTTAARAGLIFSLEPAFAALIAFVFIGERLTLREGLSAGLMILAVSASEARWFSKVARI